MKRIVGLLVCSAIITVTLAFSGCEKKDKLSMNNKEKIKNLQLPLEKDQFIDFDVYFDASKGENKIEIAKEEVLIHKEELIGEVIMNQLIKGPSMQSKLAAILPKETRLISLSIKDGVAIVNLSKEAAVNMSQGKEEACLKSISSSLTQLASVSKVKLLIDSKDVDTLGGNYDISKPFGKDEVVAKKK
jgi:spore germination protein GerM